MMQVNFTGVKQKPGCQIRWFLEKIAKRRNNRQHRKRENVYVAVPLFCVTPGILNRPTALHHTITISVLSRVQAEPEPE